MEVSATEHGSQSSAVSGTTKGVDKKSDESKSRYAILAVCAFLLLAVLLVILLIGLSRSYKQAQGGGDDDTTEQQEIHIVEPKASPTESEATTASTSLQTTTETIPLVIKKAESTTTTTTQRPIPPHTLLCTYGPRIEADTPFPEDGVCDYIMLEELPVSKADDLVNYPANIQHFVDMASRHQKTEYAIGFNSESVAEMGKILKEEPTKAYFHSLYEKKIFHFGYFTTPTHHFHAGRLHAILNVLKEIFTLMEDKKTPERPIYTIVACCWNQILDDISASDVAKAFNTIHRPDLFISKAHQVDPDYGFHHCSIVPATILKRPPNGMDDYFYDLYTGLKYLDDVHKLRPAQGATPALSISVGLSGRWYLIPRGTEDDSVVGVGCGSVRLNMETFEQEQNPSSVCKEPGLSKILESKEHHCKYFVNRDNNTAFLFDSMETLRYKLCDSKKNVTHLKYGYSAAHLEFDDPSGKCGQGKFPLLRSVKDTLEFFKSKYTAETEFEKCIAGVKPS